MATRGGSIAVGVGVAGLAAILLLLYLNSYRDSVRVSGQATGVLVAKNLIPRGTPGELIAQQQLFQVTNVARERVKEGALVDPAAIAGRSTVADVYPGQQLTAADFTVETTSAVATRISGGQRGLAVPVDQSNGLLGHLREGDRVDIYFSAPVSLNGVVETRVSLLAPNVEVLAVPVEGSNVVVLDLRGPQVPKVALANDNGKLWFALRPQSGARPTPPTYAELRSLTLGLQPVTQPVQGG